MTKTGFSGDEGQAIIEMALVMPLLLLLILGMLEFGWLLNGQITITGSAREGARTAVTFDSTGSASGPVQEATERVAAGSVLSGVEADTNYSETEVQVLVTASIEPLIGLFVSAPYRLEAVASMHLE